jgi:hypothetical protein
VTSEDWHRGGIGKTPCSLIIQVAHAYACATFSFYRQSASVGSSVIETESFSRQTRAAAGKRNVGEHICAFIVGVPTVTLDPAGSDLTCVDD